MSTSARLESLSLMSVVLVVVLMHLFLLLLRTEAGVNSHPESFLQMQAVLDFAVGELLSFQFSIIIRELVEEDGDGHPIQDDPERDATECHHTAAKGDRDHVPVTHCGDAYLHTGREKEETSKETSRD